MYKKLRLIRENTINGKAKTFKYQDKDQTRKTLKDQVKTQKGQSTYILRAKTKTNVHEITFNGQEKSLNSQDFKRKDQTLNGQEKSVSLTQVFLAFS